MWVLFKSETPLGEVGVAVHGLRSVVNEENESELVSFVLVMIFFQERLVDLQCSELLEL